MSAARSHQMPALNYVGTAGDLSDVTLALDQTAALQLTIVRAIEAVQGPLKLGRDLAYAITSAGHENFYALYPEEIQLLSSRACDRKRANWISGRAAARLALSNLRVEHSVPIFRGDAGEPVWPEGITGTITHCHPWSVAVAARCEKRSLTMGIDLESSERMRRADPDALLSIICQGAELDWVRDGDLASRLTMIFSAKEALYKALYPFCKRYIDFNEVELSWSQELSCFHSKLLSSFASDLSLRRCEISCQQHQDLFFTCSVIELYA